MKNIKDDMLLVVPTIKYKDEIKRFRQEFIEFGGDMDGCLSLKSMDTVEEWLKQVDDFSNKETCPKKYVPSTQFIYVRKSDNKIVGVIQIRHYFNEFLEKFGGHIGYSICYSERRKGYATRMLNDILPICKEMGLEKILITCLKENIGSIKTILNNGGIFENTVFEPKENVYLNRYWIKL